MVSLDIKDQDVTVKGDVAWVRHIMSGELVNNGTPGSINLKMLLVWARENGVWKLLARQAVKA